MTLNIPYYTSLCTALFKLVMPVLQFWKLHTFKFLYDRTLVKSYCALEYCLSNQLLNFHRILNSAAVISHPVDNNTSSQNIKKYIPEALFSAQSIWKGGEGGPLLRFNLHLSFTQLLLSRSRFRSSVFIRSWLSFLRNFFSDAL